MPSISVVIPTHNDSHYLERALTSVREQTRKPDEVIVIDDGSLGSRLYHRHYEIISSHIYHPLNRGAGAARNTGIRAATSRWIAFLDADDEWMPTKLEKVEEAISLWHGNIICHAEEHAAYRSTSLVRDSYYRSVFSTSAVTVRKDLLLKVGLFDESIRSGLEDFDLWQRLAPFAKPIFLKDVLGRYNPRPGNLTNGQYMAKWKDSMRLAWRYRRRVTTFDMMARICSASLQYGWLGFRDAVRNATANNKRSNPGSSDATMGADE